MVTDSTGACRASSASRSAWRAGTVTRSPRSTHRNKAHSARQDESRSRARRAAERRGDELIDAARRIEVPLLFMLQLHDEIITPELGLKLLDSFGSKVKSMHMNAGAHGEVPPFELESYEAFFVRHLGVAE